MITTINRPTLLLQEGTRVWIIGDWHKGTIRRHNARTERYAIEMDYWPGQRMHQKFIYRNRNEIIKCGG